MYRNTYEVKGTYSEELPLTKNTKELFRDEN